MVFCRLALEGLERVLRQVDGKDTARFKEPGSGQAPRIGFPEIVRASK
jgi:hypothetical protein